MRRLIQQLREGMVSGSGLRVTGFNAFRGPEVGRPMGAITVVRRYDGSEQAKGDPRGQLKKMIQKIRKPKKRSRWRRA